MVSSIHKGTESPYTIRKNFNGDFPKDGMITNGCVILVAAHITF